MAKVFDFPKNKKTDKHRWWHKPWTYLVMQYNGHDCYFCEKCGRWFISKRVGFKNLQIKNWVPYEEFKAICEGSEIADIKPALVWKLIAFERWLHGRKKHN